MAVLANPVLSKEKRDGAEAVMLCLMLGLGHRTLSRPRLPVGETAEQTAGIIMAALIDFADDRKQSRCFNSWALSG
jgi:TetR/AcrR family transcriptional repressor of uid operon